MGQLGLVKLAQIINWSESSRNLVHGGASSLVQRQQRNPHAPQELQRLHAMVMEREFNLSVNTHTHTQLSFLDQGRAVNSSLLLDLPDR